MRPYVIPKPEPAPSAEEIAEMAADSESFRALLAEVLPQSTADAPWVVAAPSDVPDRGHDAFWAAVARGLVGSGYEIKRRVATDYSRSRWVGPIGGTS